MVFCVILAHFEALFSQIQTAIMKTIDKRQASHFNAPDLCAWGFDPSYGKIWNFDFKLE